jgi:outer membrane protein assembly factor BamA
LPLSYDIDYIYDIWAMPGNMLLYSNMKTIIVSLTLMIILFSVPGLAVSSREVSGLPFAINNGQYGLYFGLIGKVSDLAGKKESLTASLYFDRRGGNGVNFIFSVPDAAYRVGKEYDLAFDLKGSFGRTIDERYYGLGNDTAGDEYSTFNSNFGKYTVALSRTLNSKIIVEGDVFFANHRLYDIDENDGIMVTGEAEDSCKDYSGVSVKLICDDRDNGTDPLSGSYAIFNADAGISPAEYFKAGIDLRNYCTPIEPDHVLASRLMINQMDGSVIPIYEYPSLGGNATMRGYGQDRWRDKSSALTELEYRIPTPIDAFYLQGLRTVFFVEAGTVGETLASMGQNKWHLASGVGLHLKLTEDFMVRGDVGIGDEGGNVYFFYGQAF